MLIVNVMAASLDGRIGLSRCENDQERIELGISSEADREFLFEQIRSCDAIIVGASSIRANGSCLVAPGNNRDSPHWYILAENPIPPSIDFWKQTDIRRTIVSKEASHYEGQVESLAYENDNLVDCVLDSMRKHRYEKALLFGGGIVNRMFYESGAVDKLKISLSPTILGHSDASFFVQPGLSSPVRLRLVSSHANENFVFLEYDISKS